MTQAGGLWYTIQKVHPSLTEYSNFVGWESDRLGQR
jgi:hypothetical protein